MADALYGSAPFVDGASVTFGSVQVISQIRSNQNVRLHKRAQHVADYFATHPGTPHPIRIHEGEETSRSLIASDLSRRTLALVQGQTLRWLVEVFMQDWKSHEGWSQLTKPPGEEGARHSGILSLLVDHSLFVHPDQQDQLQNNLPAYTVGSLRAPVQVECLIEVIDDLVWSDEPQEQLKRFT